MKFIRKYNYLLITLVFLVILYISFNSYQRTEGIIKSKYQAQTKLVENSVISALESANAAYSIAEDILNEEMKTYSLSLLEKYRSNPEIRTWNLLELQEQMDDYEIYIIDKNLRIIKTTFAADLGMDFSRFPSFSRLLRNRLEGSEFVADKMDISTNTGRIKKYSYMPTPDHQYLIELSIDIIDRYPILQEINVFTLARSLVEKYQSVDDITFYKFNKEANSIGEIIDQQDPINIDVPKQDKELVKEVILSNSIKTRIYDRQNYTITNKYIPFLTRNREGDFDWWNSFVVGLTYNNREMMNEIKREAHSFFLNLAIIIVVFISFITAMIYLLKKTEFMAYHDHLTGLANRKALESYFKKIFHRNKSGLALLYIDLDNFKTVNDCYGHDIGDKLLIQVGRRLEGMVRAKDEVSRVGGDEFTVLLTDIDQEGDALRVRDKLEARLQEPFMVEGQQITIECSIGISISTNGNLTLEELLNQADLSMYQTKKENNGEGNGTGNP
ncbi:MAG: GGDEF domain-containing protein [Halanaerobium sp.]|nr:GGDEF domain-containing protein [Halanaerobium sp.]